MTSRPKLTVSGFSELNKDKYIFGVNSVLILILDPNKGLVWFKNTGWLVKEHRLSINKAGVFVH